MSADTAEWLLQIDSPVHGPFAPHQILSKVLAREAWDRALVAPVGEDTWQEYGVWLQDKGLAAGPLA